MEGTISPKDSTLLRYVFSPSLLLTSFPFLESKEGMFFLFLFTADEFLLVINKE